MSTTIDEAPIVLRPSPRGLGFVGWMKANLFSSWISTAVSLALGYVILRAAFVPRPLHVSGWGMTRSSDNLKSGGAPKPTRRLVAPGAVYFFDRGEGNSFSRADAEALWLRRIGLCTDEGFGRVVPGIWNPKGKS